MTSIHQELIGRVSSSRLDAILLDTPFGFQQNADEIGARTINYFREHVGCEMRLASFRHGGRATALEFEQFLSLVGDANYVFAGPGSPTYALRHWRDSPVRERLIEKVNHGGCVAFASAAAIGLGAFALPVYEIYKVGADPWWTEGLDLLGEIGVRCAVIPHYDNREGGTHDTRFCYMGESRLRLLESMLPADVLILGVDEYTACIIDVDAQSVIVRGRGGVTVRRRGIERRWERTTFALSELPHLEVGPAPVSLHSASEREGNTSPMLEQARERALQGRDALHRRDIDGVVAAILETESVLNEWAADMVGTDERDRARAEMRNLIVRLGDLVRGGSDDVREYVAPLVDVLLSLRGEARREQRFKDADRLRAILGQCGVEVQDTPSGTAWSMQSQD
jgi:cyanophycinase-like exopeptidase